MVDLNKGATVGLVKALSDDIRTGADGTKRASAGAMVREIEEKADKLSVYITLRMFGAKGDGVTDDTAAFQAMISYAVSNGMPIYIPAGTYLITETLSLSSRTTITGCGWYTAKRSCILFNNDTDPLFLADGKYNVRISDLEIRGSNNWGNTSEPSESANDTNNGVEFRSCSQSEVSGCWIHGFKGNGVTLMKSQNSSSSTIQVNLTRNYIKNNSNTGISMADTHGVTISQYNVEFNGVNNIKIGTNVMECTIDNINCNFSRKTVGSAIDISCTNVQDYCTLSNIHIEDADDARSAVRSVPAVSVSANLCVIDKIYMRYNPANNYDNGIVVNADSRMVTIQNGIFRQIKNPIVSLKTGTGLKVVSSTYENIVGTFAAGNMSKITTNTANLQTVSVAVDGLSRSVVRLPYDYTVVYSSILCDVTKTQSGSVKYTLLDGSFSVLRTDTLDVSSWNNYKYKLTDVLNQYKPIYVMLETISNTDLIVCTITTY